MKFVATTAAKYRAVAPDTAVIIVAAYLKVSTLAFAPDGSLIFGSFV